MSIIQGNAHTSAGGGGYQIERSLRFNSADSAYLTRTPASAGNRQKFTISFWMKRTTLGTTDVFTGNAANGLFVTFRSDNTIYFYDFGAGASGWQIWSARVFRDVGAWYHIMLAVDTTQATDTNRAKIYINGVQETLSTWTVGAGASRYPSLNANFDWNNTNSHEIGYASNYGYFNGYLTEFYNIDGQQLTPSDFGETDSNTGVWKPKAFSGTYGTNGFYLKFADNSTFVDVASDSATGSFSKRLTSGTNIGGMTSNGGLAAAFNGAFNNEASSAVASTTTSGYVTTNSVGKDWGSGVTKTITAFQINSPTNDGFIGSQVAVGFKLQGSTDNFSSSVVDLYSGTTPAGTNQSVLVTSGVTTSTAYRYHRIVINGNGTNLTRLGQVMLYETGSFGVNQWQTNNFSVTVGAGNDSLVDSPTNYGTDTGVGGTVRGNYCTLNPLQNNGTLSNGNLDFADAGSDGWNNSKGTIGVSSGKFYWEMTANNVVSSVLCASVGGAKEALSQLPGQNDSFGVTYYADGRLYYNGTSTGGWGSSYTNGDVIGIALDMDNGKVWFSKNGTWQASGDPATGANAARSDLKTNDDTWFPMSGTFYAATTCTFNFGQRAFAYTAPSGFKALCTRNLPTPTIGATSTTQAGKYFNVKTYTGTGTSLNAVTGVGFQPDFVWIKNRTQALNHELQDVLRPTYAYLSTVTTSAENTNSSYNWFRSFDSDGFTVSTSSTSTAETDEWNGNGNALVAWNWKANGAGSSNTAGTITSTVSASTTSGFSIVTYTGNGTAGATFGHGLGVAPSMVIVKQRNASTIWIVGHISLTWNSYLRLNETTDIETSVLAWNNTSPTSTVVSLGSSSVMNGNTNTYVAYCFAPVAGYSAFGSYTGNGSTDGPFVYLGFRPRYLMVKEASGTSAASGNWVIYDAVRDTYNVCGLRLVADNSYAEGTVNAFDFLSNGFKLRTTDAGRNESGGTYIYMAFAESPFKYSLGR